MYPQDTGAGIIKLQPDAFYVQRHTSVGSIVLDVREYKWYRKSRIPGALSVPRMSDLKSFSDTLDRDLPIFVYCDGSTRSQTACSYLCDQGMKKVHLLEGGIVSWKSANFPIEKKRIRRIP